MSRGIPGGQNQPNKVSHGEVKGRWVSQLKLPSGLNRTIGANRSCSIANRGLMSGSCALVIGF